MSGFVKIVLPVLCVASATAKGPYRWFALNKEVARYERIASCVNSTARHLFNDENRLVVICRECGPLDNEIARLFMKDKPVIVATNPLNLTNERTPSYVIVETKNATNLRKVFLGEAKQYLRAFEYLIILASNNDIVRNLSRDMWQFGYRYFAFLMVHDHDYGKIALPGSYNNNELVLQVREVCTTTNELNSLIPFSEQLCLFEKCVLRYGGVSDENVKYWRMEDKFRVSGAGSSLVQKFGRLHNITIDQNVSRDLNWPAAMKLLHEDKADVVNGLIPANLAKYEGLQIICWYMSRVMVFGSRVQHRSLNEMLQLLMPFHYSIWISVACLSIVYLSLIYVLKRLWQAGLISEYIRFVQVCEIALGQGVTFPKKMGLRIVLGLWMVSSLYLNIIYNSTFTSSLARVHDEVTLSSLEDFRDTNQPFGGPRIIIPYLNDTNDKLMTDLYKRYRVMTPKDALEALISKDMMVVVQKYTVQSLDWLHRANDYIKYYSIPTPRFKFPVLFFTRMGHPYCELITLTVMRVREAGLLAKWYKVSMITEDKRLDQETGDNILTMTNLRSIFELFLIGVAISFFIFVLELLYYSLLSIVQGLTSTSKVVSLVSKKRESLALEEGGLKSQGGSEKRENYLMRFPR